MARIERRAKGGDRLDLGQAGGSLEHGRPAQRVADHQGGGHVARGQVIHRAGKVIHVRGKGGVGKLAIAVPKPGEIKAQHRDAQRRQAGGDAAGGGDVLAAGKAVGKDGCRQMWPVRQIEAGIQRACMAGKGDTFGGHGQAPWADLQSGVPGRAVQGWSQTGHAEVTRMRAEFRNIAWPVRSQERCAGVGNRYAKQSSGNADSGVDLVNGTQAGIRFRG